MFRRLVKSAGTTYCFLFMDDVKPRHIRKKWLSALCFIARGIQKDNKKVIGIATEMKIRPVCSYDFCFIDLPEWTEQQQLDMERLQKSKGIFINPSYKKLHEEEYPDN
jgi:hypothetical protein